MDFLGLQCYVPVVEKWLDFVSGRQEELAHAGMGMTMRADIQEERNQDSIWIENRIKALICGRSCGLLCCVVAKLDAECT
jgi:hypothetical protein